MMRKLLISAGVLVALGVGADLVAQRAAEAALSSTASQALGVNGAVEVDVGGFPILLDVLRGRLDDVTATVHDQRFDDLLLTTVGVRLEDLRAQGSIFGSGPLTVAARRTSLIAETDARAINQFLDRRGERARVVLLEGEVQVTAKRSVLGIPRTFVATGPIRIDGSQIVFRPREVTWDGPTFPGAEAFAREATTLREELPRLPGDVKIEDVAVGGGVIRFTGSAGARRFTVRR